jgi:hypothetical protein
MGRFWTPQEVAKLQELYPHLHTQEVAKALNMPEFRVSNKAYKMGIKKTQECLQSVAYQTYALNVLSTRFKSGQKPWNKGVKVKEVIPQESLKRMAKTQFKKGNKPHNYYTEEKGVITIRTDKRGIQYYHIKLSDSIWEPLHRHLWQLCYGPIPQGSIVVFKDGNPMNCFISNLQCITKAENALRNTFLNRPPELIKITRLKSRITRKINQLKK